MFTTHGGRWPYPDVTYNGVSYSDSGLTPAVVIPNLVDSGARYIRVSNDGIPDQSLVPYYEELHAQGIFLGVRLELGEPVRNTGLTLDEALQKAQALKDAPASCTPAPSSNPCYFDWIFVDNAMAGALSTDQLQQLMDGLRQMGWTVTSENDTNYHRSSAPQLPHGVDFHARRVGILSRGLWNRLGPDGVAQLIKDPKTPILRAGDLAFIRAVKAHDPASLPVLKFEVHDQTDELLRLPASVQDLLLQRLSEAQGQYGFRLVYPLFVPPMAGPYCSGRCFTYNSLPDPSGTLFPPQAAAQGTYATSRALISAGG